MTMVMSKALRIRQSMKRLCGHQLGLHPKSSNGAKVQGTSEASKLEMKEELMMVSPGPLKGNLIVEKTMTTIYLEGR